MRQENNPPYFFSSVIKLQRIEGSVEERRLLPTPLGILDTISPST